MKSVVLFYSYIWLLWYVGDDDFISMNNVIVFVLIITITFLLVLSLANMKMNILGKSLLSISDELLYFSLFLLFFFIYFCISCMYIFLINDCFFFSSLFWCLYFSPTLTLTLTLFLFFSFTLSVCCFFFSWFFLFLF